MISNELVIREATLNDLEGVMKMYKSLETDSENIISNFDPTIRFQAMKKYPYHRMYVVEKDGILAGTFTLSIIEYLCHQDKNAGIMEAVVVDEARRSQGIGSAMVIFAIDECKRFNCYKLALSSNMTRKQAHAFYKKKGFKVHGYSLCMDIDQQRKKGAL